MIVSNSHLFAVRVSTIVLLSMFLLPVFGQEDNQPTSEATTETLADLIEKAEQGDAGAQSNLGVMYTNGQGVLQDDEEAVKWYKEAAEQGHAGAQSNLGISYANGQGVPQDDGEAVKWFREAAEQGHAGAQSNLGVMYDKGLGVAQDYVQAHKWYNLAASQSTGEDREKYVRNRDRVAGSMTSEQIAEAQRLAREWKPKSSGSQ